MMMRVYLWKEWQVFRPTLIALSLMALLVCPALLLMPVDWIPGDFVGKVTVCAMLAISVTIGAELLPYERTGKRMEFLGRLPAGEGMAFRAKLLFLMLSLIGFTVYCYVIAQASALFIKPGFTSPVDNVHLVIVAAGIITSLWAFAISSWISRATLVLPILALFLAFGIKPLMGSQLIRIWSGIGMWHLILYLLLMTMGAVMLGWVFYLHRLGKGRGKKLKPGLVAAACMLLPWGLATWEATHWITPRPHSSEFKINMAFTGMGNQHAFLTTRTGKAPYRGVIVDLKNGNWRVEGGPDQGFSAPGLLDQNEFLSGLVGEHDFLHLYKPGEGTVCYDGQSTKTFDLGRSAELRIRLEDRIRKSKQRTSPILLPDGRRAWLMNRVLETLDENGEIEVLGWSFFENGRAGRLHGFGIRVFDIRYSGVIDLVRKRVYHIKEKWQRPRFVLPAGWLVYKDRKPVLYNPETEQVNQIRALEQGEIIGGMVRDGRLLTHHRARIYLVDLATGERVSPVLPPEVEGLKLVHASHREYLGGPHRTPSGNDIVSLVFDKQIAHLTNVCAVLDLENNSFGQLIEDVLTPISFLSDNTMLAVADNKRIERINLATGEREILFPKN